MTANVNYGAGVKTRHRDFAKAFATWQKVREEVDAAGALRLGAERWDLFCVGCGC